MITGCTLKVSEETLPGHKAYLTYESIAHPFVLLLAVTALIVSNCLIVWKLVISARFQKNNQQRQDELVFEFSFRIIGYQGP